MQNFVFHNPTLIQFGEGSIAKLGRLLPKSAKVLFIFGGGSIKKNGVYAQVIEQLSGFEYVEFSGIEANPEYQTAMKAIQIGRENDCNFVLAVGGGSVVDAGKFIAAGIPFDSEPWDILCGTKVTQSVAIGCILTLPATGSESNTSSVINRSELKQKKAFSSKLVQPAFAILDPTVTYTLPERQLINGVIDPFVHVVEQYLTYPVNAMVQDRFAEGIMQNLIELGPSVFEKDNYSNRANLMWNATQALNGLIGSGVPQDWSTHMIGHELTASYGLDHAATLAIILPRLLSEKKQQKHKKLLQYAARVWHLDTSDEDSAIQKAIDNTEAFFRSLGMKTRLSEYEIGDDAPEQVKQGLIKNGYLRLGEHGDITPDDAAKIVHLSH